jgi:hypothetical protein
MKSKGMKILDNQNWYFGALDYFFGDTSVKHSFKTGVVFW